MKIRTGDKFFKQGIKRSIIHELEHSFISSKNMEQKGEKEKNAAASFEKIQEPSISSTSSASAGPVEGPVDENGVPPLLHDRVHVAPPTPH